MSSRVDELLLKGRERRPDVWLDAGEQRASQLQKDVGRLGAQQSIFPYKSGENPLTWATSTIRARSLRSMSSFNSPGPRSPLPLSSLPAAPGLPEPPGDPVLDMADVATPERGVPHSPWAAGRGECGEASQGVAPELRF